MVVSCREMAALEGWRVAVGGASGAEVGAESGASGASGALGVPDGVGAIGAGSEMSSGASS